MSDSLVGKRKTRSAMIKETTCLLNSDSTIKDDVTYKHVERIVRSFLEVVENALESGDSVCLGPKTIGTLEVLKVRERKGRDIQKGKTIVIPSRSRIRLKPSGSLRKSLNRNLNDQSKEKQKEA